MDILTLTAVLSAIVLLILLIELTTQKMPIPLNVFLVIAGFVGSELLLLFVDDLGIRWFHISEIMLYLLVPIILFQTVFRLDFRISLNDLWIMLALALPLSLITGVSIGFLLYWLVGHPEGFPLHSAIVAGMLLASTSPTAMGFLLKAANAPERLSSIMMGEGLFNGIIAIMLFFFLLPLDTISISNGPALLALSQKFLYQLILGSLDGLLIGWLLIQLMRHTQAGFRHLVITQIGCFLSYYFANSLLGVSGVASLLPTALLMLFYMQKNQGHIDFQFTRTVWDNKRYLASGGLHILMGVSLTIGLFTQQWLAMLLGIFTALLVRAIVVFALLPPTRKLFSRTALHRSYCSVLWWGGMRGGTTIALALSLPETLTGWWTVQAIAYGAVLFSLSFQAGLLPFLVKRANHLALNHL
ncbi:MAG: hypothetical protein HAW67_00965 [Endozoicomonadaceae bacterium]|nr:hypothetical protein [Endozoicomonadaceae bacterium]